MRVFCVACLKNFHLPICEDATVSSCAGVIQYRLQKSYDSSYSWSIDERFLPPLGAIECPLDLKRSTVMKTSSELQGCLLRISPGSQDSVNHLEPISTDSKLYLQRIVEFEKSMDNAFQITFLH